MRESTRSCQGRSSVLKAARVQYYLWRGCSLGNFAVGQATVQAAAIELLYGIAGGNMNIPPLHLVGDWWDRTKIIF